MKRTPFFDVLTARGGKFVEFGGYEMPIQFEGEGIISEHLAVRNNVGVFDVSHMGEFYVEGADAEAAVNALITNDIRGMADGDVRYTLMCNEEGGIVDDFLVYRYSATKFLLVVNAGNRDKDFAWIKKHLKGNAVLNDRSDEIAQLAIQGPNAEKLIKKFIRAEDIPAVYYTFKTYNVDAGEVIVSRTGYTGEDGFEIYYPASAALDLFNDVMKAGAEFNVALCGLGCRDTLRLEAGMPLYGHEMTEETLATEVTLKPFIKLEEKDDFVGKKALLEKEPKKIRKGFKLIDRGIARGEAKVFAGDKEIGYVTTGTQSPSLKIGIGHMRIDRGVKDKEVFIDVRGKKLKAEVCPTSFLKEIHK